MICYMVKEMRYKEEDKGKSMMMHVYICCSWQNGTVHLRLKRHQTVKKLSWHSLIATPLGQRHKLVILVENSVTRKSRYLK